MVSIKGVKQRRLRVGILASVVMLSAQPAMADGPRVLASIRPLHSLAAGLMQGAGTPDLLLQEQVSPHDYALKPSDVRRIKQAELVLWIDPVLESSLARALSVHGRRARTLQMSKLDKLNRLMQRRPGVWLPDIETADTRALDAHIWLDPINAIQMVKAMAGLLSLIDPMRKDLYRRNELGLLKRLTVLDRELDRNLLDIRDRAFVVYHDALQSFESRYQLNAIAAVTVDPDHRPGARRLRQIRQAIKTQQVRCLIANPSIDARQIRPLTEGSQIEWVRIDPLGWEIPAGPELYFVLMRQIAARLRACLAKYESL